MSHSFRSWKPLPSRRPQPSNRLLDSGGRLCTAYPLGIPVSCRFHEGCISCVESHSDRNIISRRKVTTTSRNFVWRVPCRGADAKGHFICHAAGEVTHFVVPAVTLHFTCTPKLLSLKIGFISPCGIQFVHRLKSYKYPPFKTTR